METPGSSRNIWRFGIFEVDTRAAELRRNGIPVKTRDQSFRILVHLLEHAGEIVSREELRRVLWPADTFVDFEHSLNTAVMKLREALGDSADTPLYIETVPKRGYRFIAPVSQPGDNSPIRAAIIEASAPSRQPEPPVEPPKAELAESSVSAPTRSRHSIVLVAFLCFLVAAAIAFVWMRRSPSGSASPEPTIERIVPVTTEAGSALNPVFSPDDREIAFAWDGGAQPGRYDVYVQLLGAEKPLRLTYGKTGLIGAPGWSPDGRQIAFSRCDGKNDGVFVVPALGGEERKLTSVGCYYTLPQSVIWTNDGSGILMVDRCGTNAPFGIVLFSLATGQKRCMTEVGPAKGSDVWSGFALSPDGSTVAYIVTGSRDIYAVPLLGGTPRRLLSDGEPGCSTFTALGCSGLMWTPDGKSIVFVSYRTSLPSVWHVSASGGVAERETVYPSTGTFSRDGRSFVYSDSANEQPPSIWRADLAAPGSALLSEKRIIASQYPDVDAQLSPDGSRIVWSSFRTAFEELWTSSTSGADPVELTNLKGNSGTARWSPDGKWIAFDFYSKQNPQIFVIDSEGRNLRSITSGDADNVVPSWSRDGNSIYFASHRTGSWQVWRHSLINGAETQLTAHGGFDPFESLDGQTVYFSRFDQAGLWSVPVNGGLESLVVADRPQVGYWGNWAATRDGIYFLDTDAEPGPTVEFYRFATRRATPVFVLQQQPVRLEPGLSATPDGKSVFYTQYERQSVIKLIEFTH